MGSEDGGDGDGGEQTNTRFPFLATVRTLVATVVTVLAAVVVLMVIIAVNRPEKIVLYVDYGYIQAEQMWWHERQVQRPHTSNIDYSVGNPYSRGCSGITQCRGDIRVFDPVDKVELSVSVTAYNPSGRGKPIRCNITTIRILDVNSSYTGVAIGSVPDPESIIFPVLPRTTYTKAWRVTINDNATLHYLNQWYQQETSFTTMLQVDVTYSEKVGNISFYCSPVTLGYGLPTTKPEEGTRCQTSNQMTGYTVTWYPPPHVK